MVTCCDYIYIFYIFFAGIPTSRTSRNGKFFGEARAPQGQRPSALNVLLFVFCFVFFTAVLNEDKNELNNTSCSTDHTLLRPRRKTLCYDHLEQTF